MQQELWTKVDDYVTDRLFGHDAALNDVLQASTAAGLPPHHVSPPQGKLLYLLARLQNAGRILEFGTLAGYSTIWLARALPTRGRIVTLELNPQHAAVATRNFQRAGVDDRIDLHVGPALETLARISPSFTEQFDLVFIDADKENLCPYFEWAVKLSRRGSVIICDNVVREGQLANPASTDPRVQGSRGLHEMLAKDQRVSATTIQTVGCKGYDGFVLATVNDEMR